MFDSYSYEAFPYEKTVHEYKAPTDDSIRIYGEMKEKAYKSILKSIGVNNNIINFSAIIYTEFSTYEEVLQYRVMLNGKEYVGRVNEPIYRNDEDIIRLVYEHLSQELAKQIIGEAMKHAR
jgi:hypothetical protein